MRPVTAKAGDDFRVIFRLQVPKGAAYTRPYWHRDDPDRESVNQIDNEKYATLPFPPPALRARVKYSITGPGRAHGENGVSTVVVARFTDDVGKSPTRPLPLLPAFSLTPQPPTQPLS